ncbi:Response regulator rcp1 [Anaerohalosphaera lusitana]|uniref:Response regulator rcp1 n=1 Tax=Anaerohalosphaera lusitana TaxID=1936003 RepID=A0A1U9NJD7_9BACT|nr:response regulator [Anaerohalosphaera lusitana]AQT68039.1 Response regulator rcp1 [Anaerohalosphaera lusitana]
MARDVTILLAEDNEGHFILTRNYLQRQGIRNEIVWLPDGQATLDYLTNHVAGRQDEDEKDYVLILDIRMPKIDGEQVLQQMNADPELSQIPVIILTCTGSGGMIERYYELGAKAYIVKPVKYSTYLDAMKKVGLYPSSVPDGVKLIKRDSVTV